MDFCPKCKNLLYFKTDNEDSSNVSQYCKNCGYEKEIDNVTAENSLVYEKYIKEQPVNYEYVVNDFTKHDPTLPKSTMITCPNKDCKSNTEGKEKDVRYIKHDPEAMKYIYICMNCDTKWKSVY